MAVQTCNYIPNVMGFHSMQNYELVIVNFVVKAEDNYNLVHCFSCAHFVALKYLISLYSTQVLSED